MLSNSLRALGLSDISPGDAQHFDRQWTEARNQWPGIALAVEAFAAWIVDRSTTVAEARQLLLPDLYLACACARGDAHALQAVDRQLLGPLAPALARSGTAAADEVMSVLRERLFAGPAPRIASYAGRGSLGRWLKAVATRLSYELTEKSSREVPASLSALGVLAVDTGDGELEALKKVYARQLTAALREALEQLPIDDRRLLRGYYLDAQSLETLGAQRSLTASAISRRLARVRDGLAATVRARLVAELGGSSDVDSLARGIVSQLELTRSMFHTH